VPIDCEVKNRRMMLAMAKAWAKVSGFGSSRAVATPKVATFNQKVFDLYQAFIVSSLMDMGGWDGRPIGGKAHRCPQSFEEMHTHLALFCFVAAVLD
jgi:hypothetical protein